MRGRWPKDDTHGATPATRTTPQPIAGSVPFLENFTAS